MEEESSCDDHLTLIKPSSSFTTFSNNYNKFSSSPSSQEYNTNNLITDQFVDLNEWGALSDGDLCMSRQLAETIGLQNEINNLNEENEEEKSLESSKEVNEEEEEEEEEFSDVEEKEDKPNLFERNISVSDWNGFNDEIIKNESFGNLNKFENFYSNNSNNFKIDQNRDDESDLINQHINNSNIKSTTSSPSFLNIPDKSPLAPPPPPIIISPSKVDHITITLEKNQQCACADCGKLFNSVWYLKQHAVKHSNDRPFKCRFCMKTYKFRSNLYQHKCPERNRLLVAGEFNLIGHPYRRRAYTRSADKKKMKEQQKILENQKASDDQKSSNGVNHQSPCSISINTTTPIYGTQQEFNNSPQYSNFDHQQIYSTTQRGGLLIMDNHLKNEKGANQNEIFKNQCSSPSTTNTLFSNKLTTITGEFNGYYHIENKGEESNFLNKNEENIRENQQPLSSQVLEEYLHKNRHRVFNCRKCKLYFPSREYFGRHMAYHNELDTFKFHCESCPERFLTEQNLQTHHLQHADYSPHNCKNCNGIFRSALALRRHKDNWPQCHSPPVGMHLPFFVNPIDQFSFVGSDLNGNSDKEEEEEIVENYQNEESSHFKSSQSSQTIIPSELLSRKTTQDSGYHGSDTQSPAGSHSPIDDYSSGFSFEQNQKSSVKNDLSNFEIKNVYSEDYNNIDKMENCRK